MLEDAVGAERFVDLTKAAVVEGGGLETLESRRSDVDVLMARRIAADRPHILIDLGGFTSNARPGIFSLCPAPVQVMSGEGGYQRV